MKNLIFLVALIPTVCLSQVNWTDSIPYINEIPDSLLLSQDSIIVKQDCLCFEGEYSDEPTYPPIGSFELRRKRKMLITRRTDIWNEPGYIWLDDISNCYLLTALK